MIHRSHWYLQSLDVLEKCLAKISPDASRKTIYQTVREAYPFITRQYWPYKKWLEAREYMLRLKFPKLFKKPKKSRRGIVVGEPTLFDSVEAAA